MEIILAIAVVLLIGVLVWLIVTKRDSGGRLIALQEKMGLLVTQNSELKNLLDEKLRETHQASQNQYLNTMNAVQSIANQSNRLLSDVTRNLTELQSSNKQILGFSSQLQSLQDILKNPKQRGVLGEYFLEEILKNVLPPGTFQVQ